MWISQYLKMCISYATQVLSYSVVAGISTRFSLGGLPADAIHTAHFYRKVRSVI